MRAFDRPSPPYLMSNIFLILLLAMLPFASGCRLLPKEEVEDIPALIQPPEEEMVTSTLTEGSIAEELTAYARVGSAREQSLYFPIPGRIHAVQIHLGDFVKKGQPLISLETGELDFYVRQAKVNLEQEKLRYEQQFGDDSDASQALALAELNLQQAQLELNQAQERLKAAGAGTTEQQKKELQRAVERAKLTLAQSKILYNQQLRASGPDSSARKIAALSVERAQLEYDRLRRQADDSLIQAPFAGKIIAVEAIKGRAVEAFTQVAIIADMKGLEMIANVDVKDVNRLRPGMEVRVKSNTGKPWTGRIILLEQPETAQPNATEWVAHIRMNDTHFPLRLDDFYTISFVLRSAARALLVPNDALREDVSGRKYIRVLEGKRRRDVYVRIGIQSETHAQILDGAEAGMTVIGK